MILRGCLFATTALLSVLPSVAAWPRIGHDHAYFLPRLADTIAFVRLNGPVVQWWTPTFGGGLPAFANPQSIQYSLPQLLGLAMEPFQAACVSAGLLALIGCYALHRLARRTLRWDEASACLLAVAGSTSGFFVLHTAVGHVTYQAFALIPLLLWLTVDREVAAAIAVPAAGIVAAYFVYSGGYFVSPIALLSIALSVPLVHLLSDRARPLRETALVLTGAVVVGVTLSLAKLVAIGSWLAHSPRPGAADRLPSLFSPLLQLLTTPVIALGGFGGAPSELHRSLYGLPWGPWETDVSLALPVTLGAVIGGPWLAFRILHRGAARERRLALAAALLGGLVLVLASGRSPLFEWLRALPVLATLRVNTRFTAVLVLPAALLGVFVLRRLVRWRDGVSPTILVWTATGLALLQVAAYTPLVHRWAEDLGVWLPGEQLRSFGLRLRRDPTLLGPVAFVDRVTDPVALMSSRSSLLLYEPLLGAFLRDFPDRTSLVVGPAARVREGAFNMHLPPAFTYPDHVGAPPFARIPASDGENLRLFLARRRPAWSLPHHQRAANAISLTSLAVLPIALAAGHGLRRGKVRNLRRARREAR